MGVSIEVDANNVWQRQISGKLIKAEMDAVQAKAPSSAEPSLQFPNP